jgi:hypothetical protein
MGSQHVYCRRRRAYAPERRYKCIPQPRSIAERLLTASELRQSLWMANGNHVALRVI